jgi:hypothetical protein
MSALASENYSTSEGPSNAASDEPNIVDDVEQDMYPNRTRGGVLTPVLLIV